MPGKRWTKAEKKSVRQQIANGTAVSASRPACLLNLGLHGAGLSPLRYALSGVSEDATEADDLIVDQHPNECGLSFG
jgi:hypothetical protein